MIIHTVAFKLKHEAGSKGESAFLDKVRTLSTIEGINNFGIYHQVSKKNPYDFNLTMEFADQAAYDFYNQHPHHRHFVQTVWLLEVEDFLEADLVKMPD